MTELDKLNVTFDYDEETDTLDISLGTGEPSYSEEIDDIVLVNRGYFSGQVTGFQIMDVKLHGIKQVQVGTYIARAMEKERREIESFIQQRTHLPELVGKRISKNSHIRNIFAEA